MRKGKSEFQSDLAALSQGRAVDIETLVAKLKGLRKYRNTHTDTL